MSNRHMATKRAHNKVKPDVKRRKRAVSPQMPPDTITYIPEWILSFESPESSNVHAARYDPSTQQLFITFRSAEMPTYRYGDVETTLWEEFLQATSKGKFVAQRIKPFMAGVRV